MHSYHNNLLQYVSQRVCNSKRRVLYEYLYSSNIQKHNNVMLSGNWYTRVDFRGCSQAPRYFLRNVTETVWLTVFERPDAAAFCL